MSARSRTGRGARDPQGPRGRGGTRDLPWRRRGLVERARDAAQVLGHFAERMVGLNDKQAVDEAKRCMSCGMCFECDNCVIYCPQVAVKRTPKTESTMGRYVYTDYDLCIGCHICADVCPTGYIKMGMGDH